MGRYVDSHAVSEVSVCQPCRLEAMPLRLQCPCWWKEHKVLPGRWQRNLHRSWLWSRSHPHVGAAVRCCSRCNEAVDHHVSQYVLWKSVCTHTHGPWKRASSGRHEHNILPVCFIQQADLPFEGKCLLRLRHFLSVAVPFFKRKMQGFFPPFFPRHLHFSFSSLILQYFPAKKYCWHIFFCKHSLWEIENNYLYLGKKKSRLFCTFL